MTDTNQASEDELNEILNQLTGWGEWVQDPDDGSFTRVKWEGSPVLAEAKAAIQSLIRTEKLKTKMDLLKTIRRSYPKKQTLLGNAQSKLTLADIDRLIGETNLEAEL